MDNFRAEFERRVLAGTIAYNLAQTKRYGWWTARRIFKRLLDPEESCECIICDVGRRIQ